MWICVKAKSFERDITLVGTADTRDEIFDLMYDDMCNEYVAEHWLAEAIENGEADFDGENLSAWAIMDDGEDLLIIDITWKCFRV